MVCAKHGNESLHWAPLTCYRFHYALKGSQVTNLLFLARAICVNLRFKEDASLQGEALDQNLNHMRVYVGTYYLNTL
jgi:hypothetical protein